MNRPSGPPELGMVVRLVRSGSLLIIDRRLAEGGQGIVYRAVTADGVAFAVKWYRPGPYLVAQRTAVEALIAHGRPHPSFAWPLDMAVRDDLDEFGYAMPLIDERYRSLAGVLVQAVQPSFRTIASIGLALVDAFASLHGSGLCYRDLSFGNILVDPDQGDLKILDNDNVGTDGGSVFVKGTPRFMAPEIVRGERLPSTVTDLYSLAVLLFYLLVHGHPLEGVRMDHVHNLSDGSAESEGELIRRHFGTDPLFVFDPRDPSNRPLPGDPMHTWWALYPRFVRSLFLDAFTTGLHDASLSGRVTEGVWRRALLRLQDCVSVCRQCGAAVFYDPDDDRLPCWRCGTIPACPPLLELRSHRVVLVEGAEITRYHLYQDRDDRAVVGVVEPHPGAPGRVVLRNLTSSGWLVVPAGEEPKTVAANQRLAVRPMDIDFGGVRATIRVPLPD